MKALVNLHDIKGYATWRNIEPISKGWSNDLKYKLQIKNQTYLLKLTDIKHYDRKKRDYKMLQQISTLNISMNQPVDFGVCNGNKHVYILFTWLNGVDAEIELPKLSRNKQYDLGLKAGQIIQKIHSLEPSFNYVTWQEKKKKKIDKKIEGYLNCGVKCKYEEKFLTYIEQNRHLLHGRPTKLQHGDYHVGNMVIDSTGQLGVIDFNRQDIGDPWEEFNRMPFTVRVSQAFSVGLLNAYFNNNVPVDFFKLFCLYLINNAISSIPCAIPYGEKELEVMFKNIDDIYDSYCGLTTVIPRWYSDYIQ